ncbi:hypothetical protein CRI77_22025 [Mycolicibacterium duvalii]|uniref:Uncharacterized protein n=1 Tax=Mycolicibacterium duvalii TaxID=39688 RepID=A0A7I7K1P1_9MYCO|nr:hypothetical protein [Mycolicibacterium duvalii]MCV7370643.1 hypothetical protein [Mycolicibacterium duvalii]PEG36847.1 hypothetical protein CRI77_22025 [Mycolicibacterium duvalii]BBX17973.1 hypothetical protein MDUV_28330 [Mycolicibacterium duvalii]
MNVPARLVETAAQIAAGLALAAFPAFYLAVFARIAPIERQGFLALSLAIGAYVAAMLSAWVVESRLATPDADHRVALPWWMTLISVASGALLIIGPAVPPAPVLLIGVVGLMSGLLMGRSVGVVTGRWQLEAGAAALLLTACGAALLLARAQDDNSVRVLALGATAAIVARLWRAPRYAGSGMPPDLRRAAWVTGETAAVGVVQPALQAIVLVLLGPAASVGFRVISTVSGALEPILAYGRMRLLAHGSRNEIVLVAGTFVTGVAVIFGAEFLGVWSAVFGPAWDDVVIVALLLACLWKGSMLVSTVPFAALRRAGRTALVFWIRCGSTLIYLIFGVSFLLIFRSYTAAFAAFLLAEVLSFALYYYGFTRTRVQTGRQAG